MVNVAQIESQVRAILADVADGRQVANPDVPLTELGFDSLSKVEAIAQFEERFGIRFGEADINASNFATLGAIVRLVETRLS